MWFGGWSRGCFDTPSSDDVIPPLAQVHLLGRWIGMLSFRSGRLTCATLFRLRSVHAMQEPPSLPFTSHSHGSSLCGFPRTHSTEAAPAG